MSVKGGVNSFFEITATKIFLTLLLYFLVPLASEINSPCNYEQPAQPSILCKTANYVGHTPILPYDFIYMLSGNVWTDNSGVVFQRIGELLSFLWSYFVVCFLVFLYYKIMKKNMH